MNLNIIRKLSKNKCALECIYSVFIQKPCYVLPEVLSRYCLLLLEIAEGFLFVSSKNSCLDSSGDKKSGNIFAEFYEHKFIESIISLLSCFNSLRVEKQELLFHCVFKTDPSEYSTQTSPSTTLFKRNNFLILDKQTEIKMNLIKPT